MLEKIAVYERVTYSTEAGRARTIYLHRPAVIESPMMGEMLTGVEVDREGEEISGAKFANRRHLIAIECIRSRVAMKMDNTYGELIEVRR